MQNVFHQQYVLFSQKWVVVVVVFVVVVVVVVVG